MEALTTTEAARRAGMNVQKFHRAVADHGIEPVFRAPGLRGAMFWAPEDVDRLREQRRHELTAALAELDQAAS
jgi:hypothetical protein